MKLEEILQQYITPIPKLESLGRNFTGSQVLEYYKRRSRFLEIEAFMNLRFERKFRQIIETQEQQDHVAELTKEIATLSQRLFDLRFPAQQGSESH